MSFFCLYVFTERAVRVVISEAGVDATLCYAGSLLWFVLLLPGLYTLLSGHYFILLLLLVLPLQLIKVYIYIYMCFEVCSLTTASADWYSWDLIQPRSLTETQ